MNSTRLLYRGIRGGEAPGKVMAAPPQYPAIITKEGVRGDNL